jgi:hypothetical protein
MSPQPIKIKYSKDESKGTASTDVDNEVNFPPPSFSDDETEYRPNLIGGIFNNYFRNDSRSSKPFQSPFSSHGSSSQSTTKRSRQSPQSGKTVKFSRTTEEEVSEEIRKQKVERSNKLVKTNVRTNRKKTESINQVGDGNKITSYFSRKTTVQQSTKTTEVIEILPVEILSTAVVNDNYEWINDSGAARSCDNRKSAIDNAKALYPPVKMVGAINGVEALIHQSGDRKIIDQNGRTLHIEKEVLFNPKIRRPISSTARMADQGLINLFGKYGAYTIGYKSGEPLDEFTALKLLLSKTDLEIKFRWQREGYLYLNPHSINNTIMYEINNTEAKEIEKEYIKYFWIHKIHCCFNHVNYRRLKKMAANENILKKYPMLGLKWNPDVVNNYIPCSACDIAKLKDHKHKPIASRPPPTGPGHTIGVDWQGPLHWEQIEMNAIVKRLYEQQGKFSTSK